jgi:tRNA-specific 2-thiouridylase
MRPSKISAKVRYQQKSMPATIDYENNKITFDKPVFAITKGQAVVFYENDVCIGGAKII